MSTHLQAFIVRMLHDHHFCGAVYADPDAALPMLAPAERRMLVAADPRAWRVDVHRTDRVLSALIDELPVATLAALSEGHTLEDLRAFFQSAHFHDTIMDRGSLAFAFADFLGALAPSPRVQAIARLERAIAALRRADPNVATRAAELLVRGPRFVSCALAHGSLDSWHAAKAALGANPTEALLGAKPPPLGHVDPRESEYVLLERDASDEVVASFTSDALHHLLAHADVPRERRSLIALAVEEGVTEAEAEEIIDELIADDLLVADSRAGEGS